MMSDDIVQRLRARRDGALCAEAANEIERLQALAAPPAAPGDVQDALADSQYLAGVGAGWNAAQADNPNEALAAIRKGRAGYLAPITRASAAPPAAPGEYDGLICDLNSGVQSTETTASGMDLYDIEPANDLMGQAALAIAAMQAERADFHHAYRLKCDEETKTLHVKLEAAQARIAALTGVLRFYAEPDKYTDCHGADVQIPDFYSELDFGETARAALKGGENV